MKIEEITTHHLFGLELEPYPELPEDIPVYGTSDHPRHIHKKIEDKIEKLSEETGRKFHVSASVVFKENQPKRMGWRWSKHGKYIGETERQADYLYDEPEIDAVWTFHVKELKD